MPEEQKAIRKLRAIFSADVKGYSLLMVDDEAFTIKTLKEYRNIMSTQIEQYNGRVVDSPGDNVLADFASAVDAVTCAVEIQKELKEKNDKLPDNKKLEFRIGVNIGDVVQDGDRIYGSGVNVAARIEGLAEPGGVSISRNAYGQIKDKITLGYEYLGEHEIKNIKDPIKVYKVLMDPENAGKLLGQEPKRTKKKWFLPAAVIAAIIVTSIVWYFYQSTMKPDIEPASIDKMAFPLPDKPSIAVLPFDNMSGDPKQEFFSDGLTEQIISGLSKVPHLFVIARNSTFTYKGKPVKVQNVAEDLGVQYVLEGSVQRSDKRVRITAQLIDAITGHHIWSERFDHELNDIFAMQDQLTMKIITALQVKLTEGEQSRIYRKRTENLEAYFKLLQGRQQLYRFNPEANAMAHQLFQEAVTLDPKYSMAYRFLGTCHMMDVWYRTSKSPKESMELAIEMAQKALLLDETIGGAHGLLSFLYTMKRQHEKAISEGEIAIVFDPNDADAYAFYGMSLRFAGMYKEAIVVHKKAIRLNPISPPSWYLFTLGMAYCHTGQYDEAIVLCNKVLRSMPDHMFATIVITVANVLSGKEEDARITASEVLRINPKFSVQHWAKTLPYKNKADLKMYIDTLHKVGLK